MNTKAQIRLSPFPGETVPGDTFRKELSLYQDAIAGIGNQYALP